MALIVALAGVVVSVIAVAVAVWQAHISKSQLELAKDSEGRTEKALEEIRNLSRENRDLAAGMKSDIDNRINRFLDQQLRGLERDAAAKAQDDERVSQMTEEFMKKFFGGTEGDPLGGGSDQN